MAPVVEEKLSQLPVVRALGEVHLSAVGRAVHVWPEQDVGVVLGIAKAGLHPRLPATVLTAVAGRHSACRAPCVTSHRRHGSVDSPRRGSALPGASVALALVHLPSALLGCPLVVELITRHHLAPPVPGS